MGSYCFDLVADVNAGLKDFDSGVDGKVTKAHELVGGA